MLILAWVLTTVAQCLVLRCLTNSVLGVHIWEISLDDAIWETTVSHEVPTGPSIWNLYCRSDSECAILQLIHATTLSVISGTVLANLVLCIFYYRLSPITWYRHAIIFTASVTVAIFTAVWFSVQFACKPIEAAWNLRLYTGDNCIDRPPMYILQAVMGGVTDLMLMVLPLPIILGLQMSWRQKIGLLAWFGTGLLTLGAAFARLIILVPSLKNADTTYVLAQGTLWLLVEANLIIICGTLPTFRIFLDRVAPGVLRDSTRSSSGNRVSSGRKRYFGTMRYALGTIGSAQKPRQRLFDSIDDLEFFEDDVRKGEQQAPSRGDRRACTECSSAKHSDMEASV